MSRRVNLFSKVKIYSIGAEAKASLNRADELNGLDPKPSDLPMARLKVR
jgi:hypothetical protein